MTVASQTERPTELDAFAYPPPLRFAGAGLLAISGGMLPFLLYRVLIAVDPPMTPGMVLRAVAAFALLPWVAARLVRRALRAR
ncbi:MAG: hypothetical protein AB1689_13210, partial [Thermodesulfobacteriota bacterium]